MSYYATFKPPIVLDMPRPAHTQSAHTQSAHTQSAPTRLPAITPMRHSLIRAHLNIGVLGTAPVLNALFRNEELVRAYLEPFNLSVGDIQTLQHPLDLVGVYAGLARLLPLRPDDLPFAHLILSLAASGAVLLRYRRLKQARGDRGVIPFLNTPEHAQALSRSMVEPALATIAQRYPRLHTLLSQSLGFGLPAPHPALERPLTPVARVPRLIQAREALAPSLDWDLLGSSSMGHLQTADPSGGNRS